MEERRYMTLRDLKAVIRSTVGLEIPTKKQLVATGDPIEVYISQITPGYIIAAYQNGFALAISDKHYTVVRVDECGDYTYTHSDSTSDDPELLKLQRIKEDEFLDQPWPTRIMLTADDQFQDNEDNRERQWLSKHPEIPDDKNWMCGGYDSFENQVIKELMKEEFLKTLTERQCQVFRLYYEEGYTQKEIAKRLGVSQTAIFKVLQAVIKKIVNWSNQNN